MQCGAITPVANFCCGSLAALCALTASLVASTVAWAGGWDAKKGLEKTAVTGDLVCIGCSLKKLDGANAHCDLYAHHAIGFKTLDGTLWFRLETYASEQEQLSNNETPARRKETKPPHHREKPLLASTCI